MNIVLVEDDHTQADWIKTTLGTAVPGATLEVVKTESDFMAFVETISRPPDLFIVDEMLRWADPPSMNDPPAERPRAPGPAQRAGLRILTLLTTREATSHIPIILYTVLDELDVKFLGIPTSVIHVTKSSDAKSLVDAVRRATKSRAANS